MSTQEDILDGCYRDDHDSCDRIIVDKSLEIFKLKEEIAHLQKIKVLLEEWQPIYCYPMELRKALLEYNEKYGYL